MGSWFLLAVLGLLALQRLLSWKQRVSGLSLETGWQILGPAALILGIVSWGTWYFLPFKSPYAVLKAWPEGSLRLLPARRWFLGGVGAFCLTRVPGPIELLFVLGFLATYLAALRIVIKKNTWSAGLAPRISWIYELRFLWFTTLLLNWFLKPWEPIEPVRLGLSVVGLLLAFVTVEYPGLSFSYCFFNDRKDLATRFQGAFWLARLERFVWSFGLLSVVILGGWGVQHLLVSLAAYFWAGVLLNLSFRCLLNNPTWKAALVGEEVFMKCRCGDVFPNEASFRAHAGNGVRDVVDIKGHNKPSGLAARKRARTTTLEARLAFLILFWTLVFYAGQTLFHPLNPGLFRIHQATNYKTRIVDFDHETYLVHKALSDGEHRLLEQALSDTRLNLRTKEVAGDGELEEFLTFVGLGLLALGLSCSVGLGRKLVPQVFGPLLVAATVSSILGWIWVSPWMSSSCLLGLLLFQRKFSFRSKLRGFGTTMAELRTIRKKLFPGPYKRPTPCSEKESEQIVSYLKPEAFCVEIGLGLMPLLTPRESLFAKFLKDGLLEYSEAVGVAFPEVKLRDCLSLKPDRLLVVINGVPVSKPIEISIRSTHLIRPILPQPRELYGLKTLCPVTGQPAIWTTEELARDYCRVDGLEFERVAVPSQVVAARVVIQSLADHLHEFLTLEETKRLMNRATQHNNILVKKVLKIHTHRTIRKVLRPMLEEGFSIANHSTWLTVLGKGHGSVEELTRAVRAALEKEQPLEDD